jgi:PiT family inorganic phosphate transporter
MEHTVLPLALIVCLALFFDFSNGFNDAANQVATVIASRSLSPEAGLTIAAVADFAGAYFLGTNVARMVGSGIVDVSLMQSSVSGLTVLASALLGAIVWNFVAWYFGMPTSSSHALIGGLIGAFLVGWGPAPIQWKNVMTIVVVMLAAPCVGFLFTYVITKGIYFSGEALTPKANPFFRSLQVFSLIAQALAHGTNDAQKTMGVITFALVIAGVYRPLPGAPWIIPGWVILACSLTIAFGIACGGWRIIKTLGTGLYRVRPIHSFAAQTSSASIMYLASIFGYPISTTQVISSSVMGAGAAFRPKAVRWELARGMVLAWLVTIPSSALVAAVAFKLIRLFLA